jgi:hypothetical protein
MLINEAMNTVSWRCKDAETVKSSWSICPSRTETSGAARESDERSDWAPVDVDGEDLEELAGGNSKQKP